MVQKKDKKESGQKLSEDLPVHFRLMDIYLEQYEQSIPLFTKIVGDMQITVSKAAHLALKAGASLEKRSPVNAGLFESMTENFDSIAPVIMEAQLGFTKVIIDSTCRTIELLRKSITGTKQI